MQPDAERAASRSGAVPFGQTARGACALRYFRKARRFRGQDAQPCADRGMSPGDALHSSSSVPPVAPSADVHRGCAAVVRRCIFRNARRFRACGAPPVRLRRLQGGGTAAGKGKNRRAIWAGEDTASGRLDKTVAETVHAQTFLGGGHGKRLHDLPRRRGISLRPAGRSFRTWEKAFFRSVFFNA